MNILLNIPDEIVGKYQHKADMDKRSRKNLMEKVLIDYFQQPIVSTQDSNNTPGENKSHEQPKTHNTAVLPEQPKISLMDVYYAEIKAAGNIAQIKATVATLKKDDSLAAWQKQALEKYAIDISRNYDI